MNIEEFLEYKKNYVLRIIAKTGYLVPIHTSTDRLTTLNPTASMFWKLVKITDNMTSASRKIARMYNISPRAAKMDLLSFLKDLENKQLNSKGISKRTNKINTLRIPLGGSFEVTGKCNLKCFHCYAVSERRNQDLSTAQVKKIIDKLVKSGCLFLLLTGGECLSRKDFGEIYTYIRKKGIIPSINTNATLIDDNLISIFKKYPPKRIKISLYGHKSSIHDKVTKIKGSFRKVIKNSQLLKDVGLDVMFACPLFKDTSLFKNDISQFAKSINIPIRFTQGLVPTLNNQTQHLCQLGEDVKPTKKASTLSTFDSHGVYKCEAGNSSFHVDSRGYIMLCMMERGDKYSLVENTFKQCWDKIGPIRPSRLKIPYKCSNCNRISFCNVCPVLYNRFKRSNALNLYCYKEK